MRHSAKVSLISNCSSARILDIVSAGAQKNTIPAAEMNQRVAAPVRARAAVPRRYGDDQVSTLSQPKTSICKGSYVRKGKSNQLYVLNLEPHPTTKLMGVKVLDPTNDRVYWYSLDEVERV
jgi:uncharacterized protein (DUF2147 family)